MIGIEKQRRRKITQALKQDYWKAYEKVLQDFRENHPGKGQYEEIVASAEDAVVPWDERSPGDLVIEPDMLLWGNTMVSRGSTRLSAVVAPYWKDDIDRDLGWAHSPSVRTKEHHYRFIRKLALYK